MKINLIKLNNNIVTCQTQVRQKKLLIEKIKKEYANVYPLYYEDFCANKILFFKNFLLKIEQKINHKSLVEISKKPNYYKKVHSNNIQEFITNYEEVEEFIKKKKLNKYL